MMVVIGEAPDSEMKISEEDKKTFELLVAQMTVFEALSSEDKKQVMLMRVWI